jgi:hypothetical protein
MGNRRHGAAAWEFVKDHWDQANAEFPTNTIVRMVDPVKQLAAPELVADAAAFFAEHPIPQATKTLDQILERQRINAAFLARGGTIRDCRFCCSRYMERRLRLSPDGARQNRAHRYLIVPQP